MYANEGEDVEEKKEAGGGRRTEDGPLAFFRPQTSVRPAAALFFSDGDLRPPSRPTWGFFFLPPPMRGFFFEWGLALEKGMKVLLARGGNR